MSSTAVAGDFEGEPLSSRFARLRQKAKTKMARAARRTWDGVKRVGTLFKHGVVLLGWYAGLTVYKAVTGVLTAVTWTLKTVLTGITLVLLVIGATLSLAVSFVCGSIVWTVAAVTDLVDTYLLGFSVWLFQGREDSWRLFKAERVVSRMVRAERISNWFATRIIGGDVISENYQPQTGDIGDIVVPTDYANDRDQVRPNITHGEDGSELSEYALGTLATLSDKAEMAKAEVFERPTDAVPGADYVVTDGSDPFSADGTMFAPRFQALLGMVQAEETGTNPVEFDFTPYLDERAELASAFEFLSDTAATMQQRSYWRGRAEMLNYWRRFDEDDQKLTDHGMLWGLIHAHYKNQQRTFSLPHMRSGFTDQITDLAKRHAEV